MVYLTIYYILWYLSDVSLCYLSCLALLLAVTMQSVSIF